MLLGHGIAARAIVIGIKGGKVAKKNFKRQGESEGKLLGDKNGSN